MKKILLLLLLGLSWAGVAQSKYTIEKQLQLNTVLRGDIEDSILVRSADRIVKMISRKELGSNENIRPVSDSLPGIVDTIALQELGGVDKLINGVRIGRGNSDLENNTVLGKNSLTVNTTGNWNTAIGKEAMSQNTTGQANVAIGSYSHELGTTASFNVAVGSSALGKNVFGSGNVAIGASALRNNIGTEGSNIFGHRSVAIGPNAMFSNTTGNGIAIGNTALQKQTTGMYNIGLGFQAGSGITTGGSNIIIAGTGFIAPGGGITTGSNNLIIAPNNGNTTGITTGSGNIVIGKTSGLLADASNTITIADGVGNKALIKNTNGELLAPNLTKALISGDTSGKSLITKEYLEQNKTIIGVPVYADNATAIANGLVSGNIYRTATGILMITY